MRKSETYRAERKKKARAEKKMWRELPLQNAAITAPPDENGRVRARTRMRIRVA